MDLVLNRKQYNNGLLGAKKFKLKEVLEYILRYSQIFPSITEIKRNYWSQNDENSEQILEPSKSFTLQA